MYEVFSEELNLQTAELNGLTFDPEDTVCPVDAINWERGARTPSIISEICINCGICIRRCPLVQFTLMERRQSYT